MPQIYNQTHINTRLGFQGEHIAIGSIVESMNSPNPYQAPQSIIDDMPGTVVKSVYSPTQGALGTFLGGPLPGLYFLKCNFDALEDSTHSMMTLIWGGISLFAILLIAPFIPERIPKFIFPLAMAWIIKLFIEKQQFSKEDIEMSQNLKFQSNWKVVWISLLGAVIQIGIIIGIVFFYYSIGVLNDA